MSIISGRSDRLSTEFASTDEVDLSIVIPVYQSASTLQRLFEQLMGELDQLQLNYQLVFVEDGSPTIRGIC